MTLARSVVVPGMLTEYAAFADLLSDLSPEQWETPSRCDGWRVADVAAHVVGQLTDVTALRLDGLGTAEVTARQVDERRGRTAAELEDELRTSAKAAAALAEAFDDDAFTPRGRKETARRSAPGSRRCGSTRTCTPTTSCPRWAGRRRPGKGSPRRCRTSPTS